MKVLKKYSLVMALFGAVPFAFLPEAQAQLSFGNGDFTGGATTTANTAEQLSGTTLSKWVDGPEWSGGTSYAGSGSVGYDFVYTQNTGTFNVTQGAVVMANSALGSTYANAPTIGRPVAGYTGNIIGADGDYESAALQQTITGLVVNNVYVISFYVAAAQQSGYGGTTTEQWLVNLSTAPFVNSANVLNTTGAKLAQSFSLGGSANSYASDFSGWVQQTMSFTANSTSEILGFFAEGTPAGQPPFDLLANVQIVPEPTTISAGALLLLPIGVHAWRKMRKKA